MFPNLTIFYIWVMFLLEVIYLLYLVMCDVFGEQKLGSGRIWGLLFEFRSGSGINILGTSPSGFWGFGDF